MDGNTHLIIGEVIVQKSGLDSTYARWALAPDMDLHTGVHRKTYHDVTKLKDIEHAWLIDNPYVPARDKSAIAAEIISHLYADIFAGPVWCWKSYWPAIHIPRQVVSEYMNKNYYLVSNLPEAALRELHEETKQIFTEKLPISLTTEDFIRFALDELAKYSFMGKISERRALRFVNAYIGKALPAKSKISSNLTSAYYNFLNDFFRRY